MQLFCPLCNEPDANVKVSIADRSTFTCEECSDDFTREDVAKLQAKLAKWTRVLAWVDQCPRDEPAVKVAGGTS